MESFIKELRKLEASSGLRLQMSITDLSTNSTYTSQHGMPSIRSPTKEEVLKDFDDQYLNKPSKHRSNPTPFEHPGIQMVIDGFRYGYVMSKDRSVYRIRDMVSQKEYPIEFHGNIETPSYIIFNYTKLVKPGLLTRLSQDSEEWIYTMVGEEIYYRSVDPIPKSWFREDLIRLLLFRERLENSLWKYRESVCSSISNGKVYALDLKYIILVGIVEEDLLVFDK